MITTPGWSAPMGHALMSRDLAVVIGDEIIETSPMVRSRYFEGDLYKELFTEYFNRGARWTVTPRSRLLEKNFDFSYAVSRGYRDQIPTASFLEIMFDAPQVLRLGRDLLFNCSTENHRMGRRWLQRHLGEGYRVHEVSIADHHIDALVVPLRPGALILHDVVDPAALPLPLRRWDLIRYSPLDDDVTPADTASMPLLASQSIGMNVLSLDEEKVIVQDIQLPLIRSLERAGFTPVPCRWRWGRTLGGGFHCMTLDIRRRSVLEQVL
jgi:glycine amidinotransferase